MSTESSSSSGGIGFVGLLTIAFIILKLINKIDWSWWWVLSPIWIMILILILVLVVIGIIAVINYFISEKKRKNKK